MPFTINQNEFIQEQIARLPNYYSTNRIKLIGFENTENFQNWYLEKLNNNECKCHYCKTSILDIRRLINEQIISTRAVRGDGSRGPNLEIDRMDPFGEYNENNCVLSCYYCNNDKSNTFGYDIYLNVFGPARNNAWRILIDRL